MSWGHLLHHPNVKGLSPAIAAGSLALVKKNGKKEISDGCSSFLFLSKFFLMS
jgi:hypothetical protein